MFVINKSVILFFDELDGGGGSGAVDVIVVYSQTENITAFTVETEHNGGAKGADDTRPTPAAHAPLFYRRFARQNH